MDISKIGQFIAALRKSKGFTQQEVAERLGITDKTVSKWECGNGLPDITVIPAIAELFEVTSDEILRGERIIETKQTEQSQKKTVEQAEYFITSKCKRIRGFLYIVFGGTLCAFIALYALLNTTFSGPISCGVALVLCVISAVVWFHALSEIKESKRSKAVMQYQEEPLFAQINAMQSLSRINLFLILYVALLCLSLLFNSTQYGGVLPYITRSNLLHQVIALIGASVGCFIYSKMNKEV